MLIQIIAGQQTPRQPGAPLPLEGAGAPALPVVSGSNGLNAVLGRLRIGQELAEDELALLEQHDEELHAMALKAQQARLDMRGRLEVAQSVGAFAAEQEWLRSLAPGSPPAEGYASGAEQQLVYRACQNEFNRFAPKRLEIQRHARAVRTQAHQAERLRIQLQHIKSSITSAKLETAACPL